MAYKERCKMEKVEETKEKWRKFVQWDIDHTIKASCNVACRKLSKDKPLKILVDNCVVGDNAFLFFSPVYEEKIEWPPGRENTIQRASLVPRYREPANKEKEDNLRFLAGIIYLVIEGYVVLYYSDELLSERYGRIFERSYAGIEDGSYHLFANSDIDMSKLDNPNSWEWQDGLCGDSADFLNPPPEPRIKSRLKRWIENQRKSVPVFGELVKVIGKKHLLDVWHIYTANEYKMDFFLTMDFGICKSVRSQAGNPTVAGLAVKVVTPKELGEEIGVTPIPRGRFRYVWKNTVLRGKKKAPGLFGGGIGVGWDEWVDWHRYFEE